MKVWILEQDISRGENLGRMDKKIFGKCREQTARLRCISGRLGGFSLETAQR